MNKYKIIIDTDIGDDIDDAFALAMALQMPEYEILGLTTVYRNTMMRAKIAKAQLDYYGHKNIKVYCGEDLPIKEPINIFPFEKKDNQGKVVITHYQTQMADYSYESLPAIDFLLNSAEKFPGEIILFAIGPLTNIARAYQKNPDAFLKFKELVIMGGIIEEQYAEWNIKCDPEAADIVLRSGIKIKMVGLETTKKCILKDDTVNAILGLKGKGNRLLASMLQIWINNNKKSPMLHDPLTITSYIKPFCKFTEKKIKVCLNGGERGITKCSEDGVEVLYAEQVHSDAFEKFVLEHLLTAE